MKDLAVRSDWLFCHGTSEGMVRFRGKPSPDEYVHRQEPPESWEKKIEFCIENKPSLSVGRIVLDDVETVEGLWSPVGLLLEDGLVVGTGGHITGPDGRLIKILGDEPFPYNPLISPDDFKKSPYAVYELGIEKPVFSGIYICPRRVETTGDGDAYIHLQEKSLMLGKKYNLPVFLIDDHAKKKLLGNAK